MYIKTAHINWGRGKIMPLSDVPHKLSRSQEGSGHSVRCSYVIKAIPPPASLSANLASTCLYFKKNQIVYKSGTNSKVKVLFPLYQGRIWPTTSHRVYVLCRRPACNLFVCKVQCTFQTWPKQLMLTVMFHRNKNLASV